jgi:hypothetical protein
MGVVLLKDTQECNSWFPAVGCNSMAGVLNNEVWGGSPNVNMATMRNVAVVLGSFSLTWYSLPHIASVHVTEAETV